MMIDPFDAASASANSAESRSGAKTLVSLAARSASTGIVVIGSIGGMPNALLIRQSTLPNSSSAFSHQRHPRVLVGDVGRYDERAAAVRADHVGHLLQPSLGAADQHQVGAHPGRLLAQRAAQPRADAGEDDDLVLAAGGRARRRRRRPSRGGRRWWSRRKTRTCFSFGRERERTRSSGTSPRLAASWTTSPDQGPRPLTTWDGLRGAGRADRRPVQRLLVRPLPPRGPRRPRRGREQPRLQASGMVRGGRRARRAGLRRPRTRSPGRSTARPASCPTSTTASSTTPRPVRPAARLPDHLHQRDEEPPQAGATGRPRSAARST